jgi:hypothetical protein
MKNQFELTIKGHLSEGRNVLFVNSEEDNSGFSEDFITYLWANFYSGITRKGTYFHIDTPLSNEEKIKEMSEEELKDSFLTDENLYDEDDYNGWQIGHDNQTNAVYFHDPKSLLELYCSPSFEGDWGIINFSLSSQYAFNDNDNVKHIKFCDVTRFMGDIKEQKKAWRRNAYSVIDNIMEHVLNYDEMVIRTRIDKAICDSFTHSEYRDLIMNKRDANAVIELLKDTLVNQIIKSK